VNSKKNKTIHLDPPMRVSLYYWTVDVGEDGALQFLPDTYQRDRLSIRSVHHDGRGHRASGSALATTNEALYVSVADALAGLNLLRGSIAEVLACRVAAADQ